MAAPPVDIHDTQGIVVNGWADMAHAAYLFVRLPGDPAAATVWLRDIAGQVTPLDRDVRPPDHRVQLAVTDEGLKKLGAPEWMIEGLPEELTLGMPARGQVGRAAVAVRRAR